MAVLLVACPCALILATPTAMHWVHFAYQFRASSPTTTLAIADVTGTWTGFGGEWGTFAWHFTGDGRSFTGWWLAGTTGEWAGAWTGTRNPERSSQLYLADFVAPSD